MKKIVVLLISVVMCLGLFGCAKVADEEAILLELQTNTDWGLLDATDKITEIEIVSRETDKKLKRDEVWCSVTIDAGDVMYQKEAELIYGLYDEGWKLDNVIVNYPETWIINPLRGVTEDIVKESIYYKNIKVGNDDWIIEDSNVSKFSIVGQETNLEEKTDIVTVDVTIEDFVETISGQMKITYYFEDEWKVDEITGDDSFVASVKPDKELNIIETDLINELVKQEIRHEGSGMNLTLTSEEISDFEIIRNEVSYKGTQQLLTCKGVLTKPHMKLEVESQFLYNNDGTTWNSQVVHSNAKVTEVYSLEGMWEGEYNDYPNGISKLEILSVEGNEITAIYHFIPVGMYAKEAGSYNVSGKINLDTLNLTLLAGEWIDEPKYTDSYDKMDVTAVLYIDESVIAGKAHEYRNFMVEKSE